MTERTRLQVQLLVISAAVAGAAASFGVRHVPDRSAVLAALGLLFVGLMLAIVRQESMVTMIEAHLIDECAFGDHALVQADWTAYKGRDVLDKPLFSLASQVAQAAGLFAVPLTAAAACTWAAVAGSPGTTTWAILAVTGVLFLLLLVSIVDVGFSYLHTHAKAERMVAKDEHLRGAA